MNIGNRLRELRGGKGWSQGHIQKRSDLKRAYISRVECGHTEPTLTTLKKWAKAFDLELYQLFYEGKGEPVVPKVAETIARDRREEKLVDLFRRMPESDKRLFLGLAREAVKRQGKHE